MNSGFYSAFAGLAARMDALDLVANNLANANTTGFKSQHEFYTAYAAAMSNSGNSPMTPINAAINDFGVIGGTRLDMSAGSLDKTGNDTDLAIQGSAFFVIKTAAGTRYTRNGNFTLNSQRELVTATGDPVLGQQGPIQIPSGKFTIAFDGTLSVNGDVVDQLQLANLGRGVEMAPEGNGYLTAPAAEIKPATDSTVLQGSLEASNANPVSNAVALIELQRNAELLQRALSIFHNEFNQTAAQVLPQV
jgi:flagellar basal-body rod protein FlgF